MSQPHLLYIADPMCSWCWGFGAVIRVLRERQPELPIRVLMGGLRPGTTEPMSDEMRRMVREHWEHVAAASGQPFDFAFFDREGFVYDTEPASRAVVVARRSGEGAALAMLEAVQRAFYAQNRDVTDPEVLADLAAAAGLDPVAFAEAFGGEAVAQETWTDFAIAQKAGIRGFPTLLAGTGDGAAYGIVTQGFQPPDQILPEVEAWLGGEAGRPASR
ncbi:MAG TPA: DsbA family protein [Microvirga sp.]|jgi:putative protein-disulfide isomerase